MLLEYEQNLADIPSEPGYPLLPPRRKSLATQLKRLCSCRYGKNLWGISPKFYSSGTRLSSDTSRGGAAILRDPGRLEKWADKNLAEVDRRSDRLCTCRGTTPCDSFGKKFCRKQPGILVDAKLSWATKVPLQQRLNVSWTILGEMFPASQGRRSFPFLKYWWGHSRVLCPVLASQE